MSANRTGKSSTDSLLGRVIRHADAHPGATAIRFKQDTLTYKDLVERTAKLANSFQSGNHAPGSCIAVLLPNCAESVMAALAAFAVGVIYVPINPLLRRRQLLHVLRNSGATTLITTKYLFAPLAEDPEFIQLLECVVLTDSGFTPAPHLSGPAPRIEGFNEYTAGSSRRLPANKYALASEDPAVIFYTSGSTGRAKGVLLSSQNIVDGARIVAGYLDNSSSDRLLAALPLSFDYGFSQVTTALFSGGAAILTNYTLPQPLLSEALTFKATGLAGVPTMWSQLANTRFPDGDYSALRYLTNSGGRIPNTVLAEIRRRLPCARFYLMYGLTEAFRSSYLEPDKIDEKPNSIGKAIPEVELFVLDKEGKPCAPDEPGELVHSGALVTLGYWKDAAATRGKFRSLPAALANSTGDNRAVWTGDIVRRDADGYLYFQDRNDNMLKCSGYRISPTEIEDVILESGLATDVAAIGIPDSQVGQRVGIAIVSGAEHEDYDFAVRHICARELPPYMQPDQILVLEKFPLTANGKPDRTAIAALFSEVTPIDSGDLQE